MMQDINKKWVEEDSRVFSVYPDTPKPGRGVPGEEETWLELARFFQHDLEWLLSLDHNKFWSHVIFSEKIQTLLVSFLKGFPPNHVKKFLLAREDVKNTFLEIEHLVFLVFLRMSTEKESPNCYVKNLGEILYNNYLFTVPVILDICLIYGESNGELVRKMINNVISVAPNFLDDFKELMPYFFQVLRMVREKFSVESLPRLKEKAEVTSKEIEDTVLYLHDSVATVQLFLQVYPSGCQMFSKSGLITEIVNFYSNTLPDIHNEWERRMRKCWESSLVSNLMENTRLDMLKIVKSMFDFTSRESNGKGRERREEVVDEYLTLMLELLSEPLFLADYNQLHPIESEIESVIETCPDVDTMKVDHILNGVALVVSERHKEERSPEEPDLKGVRLNSLITEVKDILPHLEEAFIGECLKRHGYNTERVIAAVLESSAPAESEQQKVQEKAKDLVEHKGKHKSKHENLNELLDDREELHELKERYSRLAYLEDDTYDDEYDDTYDESIDVAIREGEEAGRRPFVTPRVLRTGEENDEVETGDQDEEEEEEEAEEGRRDLFVENPAERRNKIAAKRAEQARRDVVGRGRGRGQSKEVLRNREFKEAHKSFVANHNRKKQANRKMNRGILPS